MALASTAPIALGAFAAPARATGLPAFSQDMVVAMARDLAGQGYTPRPSVPQDWLNLTYEEYQTRWFRSHDALWSKTPRSYNVDFFLPGLYFPRPIEINTVIDGVAEKVAFDLSLFDKTDMAPDLSLDDTLGYSGFRLRTELKEPGKKNEFCVFQGALFPRDWIKQQLWPVCTWSCCENSRSRWRGIPRVHQVLAGSPGTRTEKHGRPRIDGLSLCDGSLSL